MRYSKMMQAVARLSGGDAVYSTRMAHAVELWDGMYRGQAPWNTKTVYSAGLSAAIAAETARLTTVELQAGITGNDCIRRLFFREVAGALRQHVEYGMAAGTLIIKPLAGETGLHSQFIRAGRFYPLAFDASGNVQQCAFLDQIRQNRTIFTLVEIHTLGHGGFTIENRCFCSHDDASLGAEVPLSEVERWADLSPRTTFAGLDHLPFGIFRVPLANQVDSDSLLGVSTYSRAAELLCEADRRYSDICWEYEAKQAAVHIAGSMLDYDKENDRYRVPEGRERLYRVVNYEKGMQDAPLIDVYSPEIRASSYFDGFNAQLRLIEFACNLAYGTLSDPQSVDKTAEEVKASKQRSYAYVRDCQTALERALMDWGEAAQFWARLYDLDTGTLSMKFEWGDSIISDPQLEREEDRKDLANGTLRPEEYRAKYRGETIEEALANLPQTAQVLD